MLHDVEIIVRIHKKAQLIQNRTYIVIPAADI